MNTSWDCKLFASRLRILSLRAEERQDAWSPIVRGCVITGGLATGSHDVALINTSIHRGVGRTGRVCNCFNSFLAARETVETVRRETQPLTPNRSWVLMRTASA